MLSCSQIEQNKEYLCEYISFEKSGANIIVCALISDINSGAQSLSELESTPVSVSEQTIEKAFLELENNYPGIYYKALKGIAVSDNLNPKERKELCELFLNNIRLPITTSLLVLFDISPVVYLNTFASDAQIEYIPAFDYIIQNTK